MLAWRIQFSGALKGSISIRHVDRTSSRCWQNFDDVNRVSGTRTEQTSQVLRMCPKHKLFSVFCFLGKFRLKAAHLARQRIEEGDNECILVFTPKDHEQNVSERNFPAMNLCAWHFRLQRKSFDYSEAGSPLCTASTSVNCISEGARVKEISQLENRNFLESWKLAICGIDWTWNRLSFRSNVFSDPGHQRKIPPNDCPLPFRDIIHSNQVALWML